MLDSRIAFTNVCIGLKSRAAMLGKRSYLPGPNALTSWCIVLAGVVPAEDAWKLDLCRDLECDAHPGWRERLLGGAACAWGDAFSGRVSSIDQDLFSGGLAAIAERLWTDPRCGTGTARACDIAAADAKNRSHALACHWSLWGMPTFDRAPCADWPCSTPGGSLELTPVVMPFTCASSWSVVPE